MDSATDATTTTPSAALCLPGDLRLAETERAIETLITKPGYPCIAAVRSFHAREYQVGLYGSLGAGSRWRDLRRDLIFFLQEQKKSASIYLTFWAVFEPEDGRFEGPRAEEEFEQAMWRELSYLTSLEKRESDWRNSDVASGVSDPASELFRFSLEGSELFVVGLHPSSSRLGRRFARPALVFNVFEQFEELERRGLYDPMVAQNRARDVKFQGSVNPMVEQYGDKWEAIQFSGRENAPEWKCPFHFIHESEKP